MTRAVFTVGYLALGSAIGYVVVGPLWASMRYQDDGPQVALHLDDGLGRITRLLSSTGGQVISMSTTFAIQLIGLVVLAHIAAVLLHRFRAQPTNWMKLGYIVGLLLTLAVPFTTSGTIAFAIEFPMWIIQAAVMAGTFQYMLRGFSLDPPMNWLVSGCRNEESAL